MTLRPRRRDLLRLAAGGIAALGLGSGEASALAHQTPGSGQGGRPIEPPGDAGVAKPGSLLEEDWVEPWVLRPSDWPDRVLARQAVAGAQPPRAVSPGNRSRVFGSRSRN